MPNTMAFDWRTFLRDGSHAAATRFVGRLIPEAVRGRFDGEDFVQDALADIVADPGRYDASRPPFGLVVRVAIRRLYDELRRPRQRASGGPIEEAAMVADPGRSPEECAIAAEDRDRLVAAETAMRVRAGRHGGRMPPEGAAAMLIAGHSFAEIEDAVGWRRGAAHMHFKRLRARLAICRGSS